MQTTNKREILAPNTTQTHGIWPQFKATKLMCVKSLCWGWVRIETRSGGHAWKTHGMATTVNLLVVTVRHCSPQCPCLLFAFFFFSFLCCAMGGRRLDICTSKKQERPRWRFKPPLGSWKYQTEINAGGAVWEMITEPVHGFHESS